MILRKSMLKQQEIAGSQKYVGLCAWKQLLLIASMLLPGASFVVLIPGQTVYAQIGRSQAPFVCEANNGGNGGIANHRSSGADGGTGGDCVNGPKGGDAGPGGERGSPGGPGGNVL